MDFDDFDETVSDNDLKIEQNYYERVLNDLFNSGYRDAFQVYMENEQQLQSGFNLSFKFNSKIAYLVGYIRSLLEVRNLKKLIECEQYDDDDDNILSTNRRLTDLMDNIEKQLVEHSNYENLIQNETELNEFIKKFESGLNLIKNYVLNEIDKSTDNNDNDGEKCVSVLIDQLSKHLSNL